jgi:hypothetical protein
MPYEHREREQELEPQAASSRGGFRLERLRELGCSTRPFLQESRRARLLPFRRRGLCVFSRRSF